MNITIGLIGYGSWARNAYVPALLEDAEVEIAAVAARTAETRREAMERFGEGIACFDDPLRLIRESDVDAVMIGLPSELVTDVGIAAIEARKHVWLEPPPPGNDAGRIDELLDLANASDKVFHVDMELRYHPLIAAISDLLANQLGPARSVKIIQNCNWGNTWAPDIVESGNMVSELSIWYLDVVDALINRQSHRVQQLNADRTTLDNPIVAGSALVHYDDGIQGEWAFDFQGSEQLSLRLEIATANGEIQADLITGLYRYRADPTANWIQSQALATEPTLGFVGMRECVAAFLNAIRGEGDTQTGADVFRRVHGMTTEFAGRR